MEPLVNIIKEYESDTFSASFEDLTNQEAEMLARRLFIRLCEIAEEGGTMRVDGDVLSAYLDELREEEEMNLFVPGVDDIARATPAGEGRDAR
jgi:hypothetical protein